MGRKEGTESSIGRTGMYRHRYGCRWAYYISDLLTTSVVILVVAAIDNPTTMIMLLISAEADGERKVYLLFIYYQRN